MLIGTKKFCHSYYNKDFWCMLSQKNTFRDINEVNDMNSRTVCGLETLVWQWLNWQFLNHGKTDYWRHAHPCMGQIQIALHGFQDTSGVTCKPIISQMHKNICMEYTSEIINSFLIWISMLLHDSLLYCFWSVGWKRAHNIAILVNSYCW